MIILDKNNKPISSEIFNDKQIIPSWRKGCLNEQKSTNKSKLNDYVCINGVLYKQIEDNKYLNVANGGVIYGTNQNGE
jgi:hypothetical protein